MAKGKFFYLFVVFAVAVSFISCSEEQEQKQKQKVDQQYLDSQEYSSFKKNTDEELKSNEDSENLAKDLVELTECSTISTLESSFSFDWDVLEELTTTDSCNLEKEGQQLTLLGEQPWQTLTVRWFLVENESAYRDAEVIVATFSENELRSFSTVGMYEKIPAHNIQTNITVNSNGNMMVIRSETIRDIKYPLEQKNTITAEYEIDASGGINEL